MQMPSLMKILLFDMKVSLGTIFVQEHQVIVSAKIFNFTDDERYHF